jgi:hypothetical protein
MIGSLANSSRFAQEEFVIIEHAMAACAIDAVPLQFFVKSRSRHEALELATRMFGASLKTMCCRNHFDGASISARKIAAPHDCFRHLRTDAVVVVETDAPVCPRLP